MTQHWQLLIGKRLAKNYRRSPCFDKVAGWVEPLYVAASYTHLSQLNRCFIEGICNYLDIETIIKNCWDCPLIEGKTERLADLCIQADGAEYISGLAAKSYIDESVLADHNIQLTWFGCVGYPEYPQLWNDFVREVTILDLLFNCGKDARRFMRYVCQ